MVLLRIVIFVLMAIVAAPSLAEEFSRSSFRHWIDADHDGQNSRQETLQLHSVNCVLCPYSGRCITTSEADIDHVVPLRWAWDHGAAEWTPERRKEFANDPDNLIPVLSSLNRAKGAKGPDVWLPPNLFYVPIYCVTWATICRRYGLDCDFEQISSTITRYLPMQKGVTP